MEVSYPEHPGKAPELQPAEVRRFQESKFDIERLLDEAAARAGGGAWRSASGCPT